MKERKVDLFETIYEDDVDAICVTTNGQYTVQGIAAMGGGSAGVCARRWPETAQCLGKLLRTFGENVPFAIGALDQDANYLEPTRDCIRNKEYKCLIFSFPTINKLIEGSNVELIKKSAVRMVDIANRLSLKKIMTVRFGSGIGGLNWYNEVKPAIENILDDRFTICCQENDELR